MIYQLYINALIGIASYWFVGMTLIPSQILLKYTGKVHMKPFTCELCMAWWVALAVNITLFCNFSDMKSVVLAILMSAFASFVAVLGMEFHKKLQR